MHYSRTIKFRYPANILPLTKCFKIGSIWSVKAPIMNGKNTKKTGNKYLTNKLIIKSTNDFWAENYRENTTLIFKIGGGIALTFFLITLSLYLTRIISNDIFERILGGVTMLIVIILSVILVITKTNHLYRTRVNDFFRILERYNKIVREKINWVLSDVDSLVFKENQANSILKAIMICESEYLWFDDPVKFNKNLEREAFSLMVSYIEKINEINLEIMVKEIQAKNLEQITWENLLLTDATYRANIMILKREALEVRESLKKHLKERRVFEEEVNTYILQKTRLGLFH